MDVHVITCKYMGSVQVGFPSMNDGKVHCKWYTYVIHLPVNLPSFIHYIKMSYSAHFPIVQFTPKSSQNI